MNQYPITAKTRVELTARALLESRKFGILALRTSTANRNATNSTDVDGMKQAGAIMPEIRLNSNNSTCYKSALSVVHSQKMDN